MVGIPVIKGYIAYRNFFFSPNDAIQAAATYPCYMHVPHSSVSVLIAVIKMNIFITITSTISKAKLAGQSPGDRLFVPDIPLNIIYGDSCRTGMLPSLDWHPRVNP